MEKNNFSMKLNKLLERTRKLDRQTFAIMRRKNLSFIQNELDACLSRLSTLYKTASTHKIDLMDFFESFSEINTALKNIKEQIEKTNKKSGKSIFKRFLK